MSNRTSNVQRKITDDLPDVASDQYEEIIEPDYLEPNPRHISGRLLFSKLLIQYIFNGQISLSFCPFFLFIIYHISHIWSMFCLILPVMGQPGELMTNHPSNDNRAFILDVASDVYEDVEETDDLAATPKPISGNFSIF